ncbi:MAG: hypothetical protein EU532_02610 [Promethearchaeota archaeon]|nr:MAG: hypothetical protein EU532_02610 [Candidatus Lokiarchaeota archaeon]
MSLQMIKKWKERKKKAPLHLSFVFGFITIAIIILTIGLAEAAITGYYKEIYRFSLPLAYTMVVIANVFLYLFASNITDKWKAAFIPILIIGIVLIIILFLPWNWWGVPPEDYAGKLNIRLYTNIAFITFSYLIYITIAIICYRTKKTTEDKIAKAGLTLLFCSMISLIMYFLMILFDNIMIVLYGHPGYSEFIYIAWIFAIIFYILAYFSLVMPDWLVKRIKKE